MNIAIADAFTARRLPAGADDEAVLAELHVRIIDRLRRWEAAILTGHRVTAPSRSGAAADNQDVAKKEPQAVYARLGSLNVPQLDSSGWAAGVSGAGGATQPGLIEHPSCADLAVPELDCSLQSK